MRDNMEIFCDVYGSDVDPAECEHCSMKNECFKIKLPKCQASEEEHPGNLNY